MQKTAKEIIEETASFYNSSNRAMEDTGACNYIMEGGNGETLNCAVGRCMTDEALETFGRGGASISGILSHVHRKWKDKIQEENLSGLDIILKPEYRGHNTRFWSRLQTFHDISENWDKNGMTEKGIRSKNNLLKDFPQFH